LKSQGASASSGIANKRMPTSTVVCLIGSESSYPVL
jgi:hypothetical protein